MKLHRLISYGLMAVGAAAAARAVPRRQRWEQANSFAAIMLDWDDVQAVATRALAGANRPAAVADLLHRYKEAGATHLSIPELSLARLLAKGQVNLTQGPETERTYLRVGSETLAQRLSTELQIRLPTIEAQQPEETLISFLGDLPTVAEVGLGFNPAQADLARQVELAPVARPSGYSWIQPAMIERTFSQAAALGAKMIAVQGNLIPGHEFKIQHTVEVMEQHRLTYAYFRESRHQKGDWFLAKHLAPAGLVMLAHEFEALEMLDEDWHTISYRWATLATEAGVRLCSVRFFRILHAADPLESVTYIETLTRSLQQAGFSVCEATPLDLTAHQPAQTAETLAWTGLSTAGAAGLALDLLPLPETVKLPAVIAGAAALGGLPFAGQIRSGNDHHHDHDHHHHDHDHHHHDDHDEHGHHHHHDHDHSHHHHHDDDHGHEHGPTPATAYAQKGLSLAATVAYPAAALSAAEAGPAAALGQAFGVALAGATALTVTTVETDYVLGIEEYRGYNLDWLAPLGLAAATAARWNEGGWGRWLPLAGLLALGWQQQRQTPGLDRLAALDREHRHAHTHHLSAFQQQVGDLKMAFSLRPLRKWSFLGPLGIVGAAALKNQGQTGPAGLALLASAAGQAAWLAGFRQGQRPLEKTGLDRLKSWSFGAGLAGSLWLVSRMLLRDE